MQQIFFFVLSLSSWIIFVISKSLMVTSEILNKVSIYLLIEYISKQLTGIMSFLNYHFYEKKLINSNSIYIII